MEPAILAPPPWMLKGHGTVLVYHFPERFSRERGFMSVDQQRGYLGYIGAVMMVDYRESPVGPYHELLCLPGLFAVKGKLAFSVSKIYVSTSSSVWNGYANWGIPKEQADFAITRGTDGSQDFSVYLGDSLIFGATTKAGGPTFPLSSSLVPLTRLVQEQQGKHLLTKLSLSGKAQLASVHQMEVKADAFPPVNRYKPLVAMSIQDFSMIFSAPEVL